MNHLSNSGIIQIILTLLFQRGFVYTALVATSGAGRRRRRRKATRRWERGSAGAGAVLNLSAVFAMQNSFLVSIPSKQYWLVYYFFMNHTWALFYQYQQYVSEDSTELRGNTWKKYPTIDQLYILLIL